MKIKEGFLLREVANQIVVLPTGADLDLNMMITLNESGRFLWELLEKGAQIEDLVNALLAEYDVDAQTAQTCVERFVGKLEHHGLLC